MNRRFVILGAGAQGVAAGYGIRALHPGAQVVFADVNLECAETAAARINALIPDTKRPPAVARSVDVRDENAVHNLLRETSADEPLGIISAVDYAFNPAMTRIAIHCGANMVDLGGNLAATSAQLELDEPAQDANVSIVPDCGMGPGFNINLAIHAMQQVCDPTSVRIYCGGLPLAPKNEPFNYELLFSLKGLVNEYSGNAVILENGAPTEVPALSGVEPFTLCHVGTFEAAYTSGGLSIAPWTLLASCPSLEQLSYKTLRYPGHWAHVQALAAEGRLEEGLRESLGDSPQAGVPDMGIIVAIADGVSTFGVPIRALARVVDFADEATGFTAMQRLTGFHAAVAAILQAQGEVPEGVTSVDELNSSDVLQGMSSLGIRACTMLLPRDGICG